MRFNGKWADGTRPNALFQRELSKRPAEYVSALVVGLATQAPILHREAACTIGNLARSAHRPTLPYRARSRKIRSLRPKPAPTRGE